MAKSNKSILEHILSYCNEIQTTMLRFGDNLDTFINDIDYRKSVSLSILQIGELAGKLSDEYRQSTTEMPWRQIRGLRNIVAHSYGEVDFETAEPRGKNPHMGAVDFSSGQLPCIRGGGKPLVGTHA